MIQTEAIRDPGRGLFLPPGLMGDQDRRVMIPRRRVIAPRHAREQHRIVDPKQDKEYRALIHPATVGAFMASGGAASSNPWDDLANACSNITMQSQLYYDASLIATVSGEISAMACALASGHDGAQATPARRPHAGVTYCELDASNTEYLVWDWSSGVGAGNVTGVALYDFQSDANAIGTVCDWQTGRLAFWCNQDTNNDYIKYYDGSNSEGSHAATTGKHRVIWECINSTGRILEDGVAVDTGLSYAQRALGGDAVVGARYDGAANWGDIHLLCLAVCTDVNTADTAAMDAVMAGW